MNTSSAEELELSEKLYLFRNVSPSEVSLDPFPHVLKESVLDEEWILRLTRESPPLQSFLKPGVEYPDNYKHYRFHASLLNDPTLSPTWRLFIKRHLLPAVIGDMWNVLGEHALRVYPDLLERFGPFNAERIHVRGSPEAPTDAPLLDTILVSHQPVSGPPCVERTPHVKATHKVIEAHFYLSDENDSDPGGDLVLYSIPEGVQPRFDETRQTDCSELEVVRIIPYRANTLFLFLNTAQTITSLSLRGPSEHPLRYFCIVFQLPGVLFDLP